MPDPPQDPPITTIGGKLARLSPLERLEELLPWRRATQLTRCYLYWMPVSAFPAPMQQRAWMLQFFERLSESLKNEAGFQEEIFFNFKAFLQLKNVFMNHQQEFYPILGLSRRPGAKLQSPPTEEEITAMGREMLQTMKPPDAMKFMPDYCYWFAKKLPQKQRELFLGHAALTTLYLKLDPSSPRLKLPPQLHFLKKRPDLKNMDIDGQLEMASSLSSGFLAKSKNLFGTGLEDEPQFKGLMYILPLLNTSDFFNRSEDEAKTWFDLFDVYVRESQEDHGVFMAFKNDFEEQIIGIVKKMKEEGLAYPER